MEITELERTILVAVESLQHGNGRTYEGNGWPIVLDEGVPKALILADLCRRTDIDFQVAQLDSTLSKMVTLGWLRKEIKDLSYWPDISYKRSDGLMVISCRLHGCPYHEVLLDGQQVVIAEMMEQGSYETGDVEGFTCYQITEVGLHVLERVQDAPRHGSDVETTPQVRLTSTQEVILKTLGDQTLIGERIAQRAKRKCNGHFKGALSDLVKFDMLEKTGRGYRATPKGHAARPAD